MENDSYTALDYLKLSAEESRLDGDARKRLFTLADYAQQLNFLGEQETSVALLDSIREVALRTPVDSTLLSYTDRILVDALIDESDIFKADSIQRELLGLGRFHYITQSDTINQWWIHLRKGENEEAKSLIDKVAENVTDDLEKSFVLVGYRKYYENSGLYEQANKLADTIVDLQNSYMQEKMRQSIPALQRDRYIGTTKDAEDYNSRLRLYIIVIVIVSVLVLGGGIVFYYLNDKLQKSRIETILESNRELQAANANEKQQLLKAQNELKEIAQVEQQAMQDQISANDSLAKDKLEKMLGQRWKELNLLSDQYFNLEKDDSTILKNLQKAIDNLKKPKALEEIKATVNMCLDGAADLFEEECGFLCRRDLWIGILTFSRMSVKTICLLLEVKRNELYTYKGRIVQKIRQRDVSHAELFIQLMEKKSKK